VRNTIAKAIYIKNIVTFTVVSCLGIVALVTLGKELAASLSAGEEIFIPGVALLILAVLLVFLFAVTRVIKYVRLCRGE
jgi:hypothetical protein